MKYTRTRLYLGIVNVLVWVILAILALASDLPRTLFPIVEADANEAALRISTMILLYFLINFPFDILGGYLLPRQNNERRVSLGGFLISWLRASLVQFAIMFISAMLLWTAGRQSRTVGVVVFVFGVLMLALVWLQEWIARLSARVERVAVVDLESSDKVLEKWGLGMPEDVAVYSTNEPAFTGALVGLPGMERLILPAWLFSELPAEGIAVQVARRIGVVANESRARGVFLALGWNLLGFWLAINVTGPIPALASVSGLMATVLWFNLWSALGLIVLPLFSRPAVFSADRFAKKSGALQKSMEDTLTKLDTLQENYAVPNELMDHVFNPTPTLTDRLGELNRKRGGDSPVSSWLASRLALFLSLPALGLFSRSMPYNIGRPVLWVLHPSE